MRNLFLIVALILPFAARGAEAPRTIDMTTIITDMHGRAIPDGSQAIPLIGVDGKPVIGPDAKPETDCSKCGPLTLGTVVASALFTDRKDEPYLPSLDKGKRGALALRIVDDKAVVLTATQVAEIIRLLGIWSPLIVARALPLIDPATDIGEAAH